jgi:hypothetical protein
MVGVSRCQATLAKSSSEVEMVRGTLGDELLSACVGVATPLETLQTEVYERKSVIATKQSLESAVVLEKVLDLAEPE